MRIACLQFAPEVGDVSNNLNRADAVLSKSNPQELDLLVLPELAFSGYNFKSLQHISPFLEPTASGITSRWARTTALKYGCIVTVGYPEKVDMTSKWPASPEYYNSAMTVNAKGETIANYRKSFLYYTDETWALEGPDGFYDGVIPGLGNVAMGICMDLNPYKFEAPWDAWEFAYHIIHRESNLVILSMAWLTREEARPYSRAPKEPDMETLSYWLARLEPVIRAENEGEIIVVLANRCGTEDEAVYAGTSAVLGIQAGEVKVYGILGRGERELLIVDTTLHPQAKLICDPITRLADPKRESTASGSPESRTSSVESTFSDQDSPTSNLTNLSINTRTTTERVSSFTPATPDAMQVMFDDIITPISNDTVTPISPVDPNQPNMFFGIFQGHMPEVGSRRESLRSTIEAPQIIDVPETFVPQPDDPTLSLRRTQQARIASPPHDAQYQDLHLKRDHERDQNDYPKMSGELSSMKPHMTLFEALQSLAHDHCDETDNPSLFGRPPSPKHHDSSHVWHQDYSDPTVISRDLDPEPRNFAAPLRGETPPHSASIVLDHHKQIPIDNGPGISGFRERSKAPRPRSMLW